MTDTGAVRAIKFLVRVGQLIGGLFAIFYISRMYFIAEDVTVQIGLMLFSLNILVAIICAEILARGLESLAIKFEND